MNGGVGLLLLWMATHFTTGFLIYVAHVLYGRILNSWIHSIASYTGSVHVYTELSLHVYLYRS